MNSAMVDAFFSHTSLVNQIYPYNYVLPSFINYFGETFGHCLPINRDFAPFNYGKKEKSELATVLENNQHYLMN
jgi:hypothetical protein